jgi:hypothetical protein
MDNAERLVWVRPLILSIVICGGIAQHARAHSISAWVVSFAGTGPWQKINSSGVALSNLRFSDFDGNGKTDVFRAGGGKWFVSADGVGQWQEINTSAVALSELRFGDFNGNGKTDVFRAGGGKWFVSTDGVGQWQQINTSNVAVANMRFGDFNGNGKTDVFRSGGGKWFVSTDGVGQWQEINTSSIALSNLRFGDFNGNGKTDVFRTGGGKWFVSSDGVGQWQEINTSSIPASELTFGDFDGDGKTDVFRVADEDHVGLGISRFTTSTLNNAAADTILAAATNVLQTNDGVGDRACLVHFTRVGDVTVFATGDGSIDSQAEFNAVSALPGNAKVVNQINWCGRIGFNFIGCGQTPGRSFAVVRVASDEGILWAHEYGHTQGLPHRSDTSNAVMFASIGANRTRVNASECTAYRQ